MASVVISGDTSGTATLQAQAVAGNTTLTLPTASGTLITTASGQTLTSPTITSPTITGAVMSSMASSVITSGTAVASTSGTSIDFTGIPSWAKRITVMLADVSLNGGATTVIRLGTSSGIVTTGYASYYVEITATPNNASSSSGFIIDLPNGGGTVTQGLFTINNINGNTWVMGGNSYSDGAVNACVGNIALVSTLTQLRVTTSGGTNTFDAGLINILYE